MNEWVEENGEHFLTVAQIGCLVIVPYDTFGYYTLYWAGNPNRLYVDNGYSISGGDFEYSVYGLDAAKKRGIEWAKELITEALESLI